MLDFGGSLAVSTAAPRLTGVNSQE